MRRRKREVVKGCMGMGTCGRVKRSSNLISSSLGELSIFSFITGIRKKLIEYVCSRFFLQREPVG